MALFVLLAVLLVQLSSLPAAVAQRAVSRNYGPPLFFLQDLTDGLCLAGAHFERCGVRSLWHVTGKPGSYQLHQHRLPRDPEDPDDDEEDLKESESDEGERERERCLRRVDCTPSAEESELSLSPCASSSPLSSAASSCGLRKWNIVGDANTGFALAEDKNKMCVLRRKTPSHTGTHTNTTHTHDTAVLVRCEKGYAQFSLQFVTHAQLTAMRGPAARLVRSALRGDLSTVRRLLDTRAVDVNAPDWDNVTAVIAAATQGHTALLTELVHTHSAEVDTPDKDGITALLEAARAGHAESVSFLLANKANPHHTAISGVSALWLAAAEGHTAVVQQLLNLEQQPSVDLNNVRTDSVSVLMAAAGGNHSDVVSLLLTHADTHTHIHTDTEREREPLQVDAVDSAGASAFIHAAESGCVECVRSLLARSDVSRERLTHTGFTALIVAAAQGQQAVLRELLHPSPPVPPEHAVSVHTQNPDGVTALMYAAAGGDAESVRLLIEAKSDVNAIHAQGGTALIEAATAGHGEAVNLLIQHKANIHTADKDGLNALLSAAAQGHTSVCETLLLHKADVHATAQQGSTALHLSADAGHTETVRVLLAHKADVNAQVLASPEYIERLAEKKKSKKTDTSADTLAQSGESESESEEEAHRDGVTPLMLASQRAHTEVVSLLLAHKADATLRDDEDASALQYALLSQAQAQTQTQAAHTQEEVQRQKEILTMLVSHGVPLADNSESESESESETATETLTQAQTQTHMLTAADQLLLESIAENHTALTLALIARAHTDEKALNVSVTDDSGVSALTQAAFSGQKLVVEALLKARANVHAVNSEGIDALIAAASEGHTEIVRMLLDHDTHTDSSRVDVNKADVDGTSALMAAAVRAHNDVISLLLDRKAEINAQNVDGHSALMFAYNGKHQVQQLLEKYRVFLSSASSSVEREEEESTISLVEQALAQHTQAVQLLIARGADVSLQDKEGHIASDFDYTPPAANTNTAAAAEEKAKAEKTARNEERIEL